MRPKLNDTGSGDRPRSRNLGPLLRLLRFAWPYRARLALAMRHCWSPPSPCSPSGR
jgi:hypothetical protein